MFYSNQISSGCVEYTKIHIQRSDTHLSWVSPDGSNSSVIFKFWNQAFNTPWSFQEESCFRVQTSEGLTYTGEKNVDWFG